MSRLLIALALSALLIPVGASAATNGLGIEWVRGPVVAVQTCSPAGVAVTVGGSATTTLIYQSFVAFPKGVVPPIGHYALALALGTVTCNTGASTISGKAATYATFLPLPPATPLIKPPSSGSGSGSGSSNSILDKIKGMLQGLIKPPTQSQPSQATPSTGASTASGVGGVFGGTIGKVQPCDPATSFPSGTKFLVTIEGGAPGLFTYGAYSKSYICGPAIVPGKNTVGSYTPGAGCDIDLSPTNVVMIEAKGWMDANPGHGTSGCEAPTTPPKQEEKPGTPTQCGSLPGGGTAAQELNAERNVRDYFKACNIPVTSTKTDGAPCLSGQDGVKAGCTSVGGMQCNLAKELCELRGCGPLSVGGGSEFGHSEFGYKGMHGSGNAADLNKNSKLNECIQTQFTKIPCPEILNAPKASCFRNPTTGTVYYDEGSHWHVCTNKFCR